MNLLESIRSQLTTSIKAKNEITKGILRVVLGDLSTLASRSGKTPTDDDVRRIVKKLLEGNNETLKYVEPIKDVNLYDKLTEENRILNTLLPQTLSRDGVRAKLESLRPLSSVMVIHEICIAKSDGQATGAAMKYFKQQGINVDGTDVAAVVKEFRTPSLL